MKTPKTFNHEFVESFPDKLEEGKLYVSMEYASVAHNCACGCGHEVITPLSPAEWKMTFDGESISLRPSIGNWSFDCQSHYWIESSQVQWAAQWSRQEIASTRHGDCRAQTAYYDLAPVNTVPSEVPDARPETPKPEGFLKRLLRCLRFRSYNM